MPAESLSMAPECILGKLLFFPQTTFNTMKRMLLIKRFFFIVFLCVSVSACQVENVGDLISEGQDLLVSPEIPPSEPTPANISPGDSTPVFPIEDISSLYVFNIKIIQDHPEPNRVIGLVINQTEHWVANIKVDIQIYDSNDALLVNDTTTTSINSLSSGEISPFVLWLDDTLPNEVYTIATVSDYDQTELQRVEVVIRKDSITYDDRDYIHITGELYNHNLLPIIVHNLAVATFDPDGNLSNSDSHSIYSHYLDPGEVSPFRATLHGAGGIAQDNISYKVFIDASVTKPEDFLDLEINPDLNHFVDRFGLFHLVGEITNNSEYALDTHLLAAIYDSDGLIVDVSTTRLPLFAIPNGETLPFDFNTWGPLNFKEGSIDSATAFSVQWDPYWTRHSDINYVPLAIDGKNKQIYPTHGIFSGTLINTSASRISSATVIVSLYDINTGALLAINAREIIEVLLTGISINYEVNLDFPETIDLDTVNIQISAFGKIP